MVIVENCDCKELEEAKILLNLFGASKPISYDLLQTLYHSHIGDKLTLNSESNLVINLSDEKWMSLIKDLSKVFLPKLNSINIYSVPSDSEEVRSFISKSFTSLSRFNFNNNCKKWIDASKYLEALKMAANKDVEHFGVFKTRFTAKEFCELISSAKNVRFLYIEYCTIPLDDVVDFGQMERSKIHFIYFYYTGDENYSNWKSFPLRYENLIAGISKSEGLKRSLKKLDIRYCDIPKENAQAILDKYKLNEIKIIA